jgi:tetratricopeptide (TPR) repeat protein
MPNPRVPPERTFSALHNAVQRIQTDALVDDSNGHLDTIISDVPWQLPPEVDSFTDRESVLAALASVWERRHHDSSPVALLVGTAGVGKTAVAIRWARAIEASFGDGTLYANLRGYDPTNEPMSVAEALSQFIRSVGLTGQPIPHSLEERTAIYRTLTAKRNLLVVLDNAASAEQVRPLIPASPSSMVLVTSRSNLSGLVARDGAVRIVVPVLTEEDSKELLEKLLGPERLVTAAADVLVRRCVRLPLALRIAAEIIMRSQFRTVADTLEDLQDGQDALYSLDLPGDDEASNMRSVLSWSYNSLTPEVARAFRALGLHPGTSLSLESAAAILGESRPRARRLLSELTEAHLLEETARNTFSFHDLLRAYAIDRSLSEDTQQIRSQAVQRILSWYLHTADAANRKLAPYRRHVSLPKLPEAVTIPIFADYDSAMAWCEQERENLVSATRIALEEGLYDLAWRLPSALFSFFYIRWYSDDWIETYKHGIVAAERANDLEGKSIMLNRLGVAYKEQGLFSDALPRFQEALKIRRGLSDDQGVATALTNIGLCLTGLGRATEAVSQYEEALMISRAMDDKWTVSWILHNLGEAEIALDHLERALTAQQESLEVSDEIGDRIIRGDALRQLGEIQTALGAHTDALESDRRALEVCRELGYRATEARVLSNMGMTYSRLGNQEESATAYRESVLLSERVGDRYAAARTMTYWAQTLLTDSGVEKRADALALLRDASAVFTELGSEADANHVDEIIARVDAQ